MVGAKERRNASADAHGKPMYRASAHLIASSWTWANMFRPSLRLCPPVSVTPIQKARFKRPVPLSSSHKASQLDGLIVTKLDGSGKGGIAVTIHDQLGIPPASSASARKRRRFPTSRKRHSFGRSCEFPRAAAGLTPWGRQRTGQMVRLIGATPPISSLLSHVASQ